MIEAYTFDDVLIIPKFSTIKSRKDVDLSSSIKTKSAVHKFSLLVVSSNMDTVTGEDMAIAMINAGGVGCLHRFWSIEDNKQAVIKVMQATNIAPMVSVGLGEKELERAQVLYTTGADILVLDVAHGAQEQVVQQYIKLKDMLPDSFIIVGNFAGALAIYRFQESLEQLSNNKYKDVDAVKVGVGPSSICATREKTGCGVPQLYAIQECCRAHNFVVADGGMKTPGCIAKALAAGAQLVMLGSMLAGTDETPGETFSNSQLITVDAKGNIARADKYKVFRGSAAKSSYADQGKAQEYITAEGIETKVPCKGPVADVLADIAGGLRSSFTYVGAANLDEFQERSEFIKVTNNTLIENKTRS